MKQARLTKLILSPHISEKASTSIETNGQYAFRVVNNATKLDIKEAVEQMFKIKVTAVRIVNVKSKPKRFGNIQGKSKGWKKAYVSLQAGYRIDFSDIK